MLHDDVAERLVVIGVKLKRGGVLVVVGVCQKTKAHERVRAQRQAGLPRECRAAGDAPAFLDTASPSDNRGNKANGKKQQCEPRAITTEQHERSPVLLSPQVLRPRRETL